MKFSFWGKKDLNTCNFLQDNPIWRLKSLSVGPRRTTAAISGVVWSRGRQVRGCQGEIQYHLACAWTRHWVRLLIEEISFGSHNKPREHIWLSSIYWIDTERLRNLPNCSKIINVRTKTWSEYIWSQSISPLSVLIPHFLTYIRAYVHLGRHGHSEKEGWNFSLVAKMRNLLHNGECLSCPSKQSSRQLVWE